MTNELNMKMSDIGFGKPNHFGFLGIGEKADPETEREARYQEALRLFPFDVKSGNCAQLEAIIKNISNDIAASMEEKVRSMASGGSGRPQEYHIYGFTRRKNELVNQYNLMMCDALKQKQEQQEFLDSQLSQIEKAQGLVAKTQNPAIKYIVYGMIGTVVIVSIILISKS